MNWYSLNKLSGDEGQSGTGDSLWSQISKYGPKIHPYGEGYTLEGAKEYSRRSSFVSRYSWAVPSPGALEKLKDWLGGSKVIEVAAGRGLWARLLRDMGVTVEASDMHAPERNEFLQNRRGDKDNPEWSPHTWTEVSNRPGDEHAKEGSGSDALMMVWPYMDEEGADKDWQRDALENFGGDKFILVGEGEGGATGSTGLWKTLNNGWRHDGIIDIPRWEGMHDRIFLFRRK